MRKNITLYLASGGTGTVSKEMVAEIDKRAELVLPQGRQAAFQVTRGPGHATASAFQ